MSELNNTVAGEAHVTHKWRLAAGGLLIVAALLKWFYPGSSLGHEEVIVLTPFWRTVLIG